MVLMGILVVQDVLLGLLMAVLPIMSGSLTSEQRSMPPIAVYGFLILELIAGKDTRKAWKQWYIVHVCKN